MRSIIETYAQLVRDQSGIKAILNEMDAQLADAKQTLETEKAAIATFAKAVKQHKSLLLLGMGASHYANELFSFQLRKLGIKALAISASEFLYDPLPEWEGPILLTSQSGESVETVRCLQLLQTKQLFSITLNRESTIGRNSQAIVAAGGEEKAFAGTRSVTLSLVIMAGVCTHLGLGKKRDIIDAIQTMPEPLEALHAAVGALSQADQVIATGRSLFASMAHLFALGCEELSRRAVLSLETGQLRHGPMEILNEETALVIFRQDGTTGQLASSFESLQLKAGFQTVVFDASEEAEMEGAITIKFPAGEDIYTALTMMTAFQTLMIAYACTKNPYTGLPKYGSKVTVTE